VLPLRLEHAMTPTDKYASNSRPTSTNNVSQEWEGPTVMLAPAYETLTTLVNRGPSSTLRLNVRHCMQTQRLARSTRLPVRTLTLAVCSACAPHGAERGFGDSTIETPDDCHVASRLADARAGENFLACRRRRPRRRRRSTTPSARARAPPPTHPTRRQLVSDAVRRRVVVMSSETDQVVPVARTREFCSQNGFEFRVARGAFGGARSVVVHTRSVVTSKLRYTCTMVLE
jgi:hypothetical protein